MKSRGTTNYALAFLFTSGCAFIDGLKDGNFCLVAGDGIDPTNPTHSDTPNCGRIDGDQFISTTYLTSLLTSETRTIPLTIVERGGTSSDEPLELSIRRAGDGFNVVIGAITTRDEITLDNHPALLTKTTLTITAPSTPRTEAYEIEAKGAQGQTYFILGLNAFDKSEVGAAAGADLAANDRAMILTDCNARGGAKWPRVIEIDPQNLHATRTLYTPPVTIPGCNSNQATSNDNSGCDDNNSSPPPNNNGGVGDCGCSGGFYCFNSDSGGGCAGESACLTAIALEPASKKALIGTAGGGIISLDLENKSFTSAGTVANFGGVKRITLDETTNRVTILATKPEQTSAITGGTREQLDALANLVDLDAADDIAPIGGERFAIHRSSALSWVDLSAMRAERSEHVITGGFESAGPRILARPGGSAVITGRLEEIEIATGRKRRGFDSAVTGTNTGLFVAALIFDPLNTEQLLTLRAMNHFSNGTTNRPGALERTLVTSTTTITTFPMDGPNQNAIAIHGNELFLTRNQNLVRIDLTTNTVSSLPYQNMNMATNYRRLVMVDGVTGFAITTQGSAPQIKKINFSTGEVSDFVIGTSCAVDIAFAQGRLLILDREQDAVVSYDPFGGAVSQIVARLGLNELSGQNNNGNPQCNNSFNIDVGLTVDAQDTVWVSSLYYGLFRASLDGSDQKGERVYLPPLGGRIEAAGTTLVVADNFGGLVLFDPETSSKKRISVPFLMQDVARGPAGSSVYALSSKDGVPGTFVARIALE